MKINDKLKEMLIDPIVGVLLGVIVLIALAPSMAFAQTYTWDDFTPNENKPAEETTTPSTQRTYIPVYRLYNQYTGEHLYTISETENYNLSTYHGWTAEGIAWSAPSISDYPVYRLYNPYISDHLYTTDINEYNSLPANGWTQEGIAFYAGPADTYRPDNMNYGSPIYRLYNPYNGRHLLTLSAEEYGNLSKYVWSWRGEGIAFRAC